MKYQTVIFHNFDCAFPVVNLSACALIKPIKVSPHIDEITQFHFFVVFNKLLLIHVNKNKLNNQRRKLAIAAAIEPVTSRKRTIK